ncbi:Protein bem46 [Sparassis crispa]|uniref:Protein bem46 n=1 Tax=Sparassis crispa TaxID=139825 RepID=A0A401GSM9_9APHY|nr:Protein bem46 [Sparassis crispa]GBE85217.1 Protein bem46 [Sparassis crispa]
MFLNLLGSRLQMVICSDYTNAGKTLDFKLHTSDDVTLGAWFILSEPYYQSLRTSAPAPLSTPSMDTIQSAMRAHPTVLYLHGAAGTRATAWRVQHFTSFTSRLQVNLLTIDYRGFADSEGSPSEDGLALDAYTAWTWLLDHGAKAEDILVVGHSLGTGVAGKLGSQLAKEGVRPRGIVLLAPFSSVTSLAETYNPMGYPILQPLQRFAWGRKLVRRLIIDAFDTLSVIEEFNVPTLIAHSVDDFEVPHSHSHTLLERLLDTILPPPGVLPSTPGIVVNGPEFAAFTDAQSKRRDARTALVRKVEVPNFGTVEEFDGKYGRVVYVESLWGSHSKVGLQEGVQDVIATTFGLTGAAVNSS